MQSDYVRAQLLELSLKRILEKTKGSKNKRIEEIGIIAQCALDVAAKEKGVDARAGR